MMLSYVMLSGFLPFSHDSKPALFELIRRGDFEFPSPWWDDVSPEAKVCVCVCVCIQRERERERERDAKQRFSVTRNILGHSLSGIFFVSGSHQQPPHSRCETALFCGPVSASPMDSK
jgi:hypothetical protein